MRTSLTAVAAIMLLSGCATTPVSRPVDVLRYHLGDAQVARGTVVVAAVDPTGAPIAAAPIDFRAYADAVQDELLRNGYTLAAPGVPSRYVASVVYRRGLRPAPDSGPRFSLGIGGASFGRHGGVGGGVGVPIGGNHVREVAGTELSVKISERGGAGAGVIWEGRAMTEADTRSADAAPEGAAHKLASALFQGFPGESGRTITIK